MAVVHSVIQGLTLTPLSFPRCSICRVECGDVTHFPKIGKGSESRKGVPQNTDENLTNGHTESHGTMESVGSIYSRKEANVPRQISGL